MRMQRVPSTDKEEKNVGVDEDDLLTKPYYFNNLSTSDSVEILKTIKKEGAFLVRKRTTGDIQTQPYALSVYYDSKIHHTRINRDSNGQFCLGESKDPKNKVQKFNSIPEIINCLDTSENCKLSTKHNNMIAWYKLNPNPAVSFSDDSSLDMLPYFFRNSTRDEVGKILKQIQKSEIFFIRKLSDEQLSTPYELAVYHKSYVYYLKINKSPYEEFSVEFNKMSFESLPDLVKYYNYEKLQISTDTYTKLSIHSKYILTENS